VPRFGRQDNRRTERTAEDRERARQERAARRAAREGRTEPPPLELVPPLEEPAEPPPAQQEEPAPHAPEPEPAAREPEPEPEPELEPAPREPEPAEDASATREFSAAERAEARGATVRTEDPDDLDIAWQDAARRGGEPLPDRPVRRIQPEPAAPPPAPAGTLSDTEPQVTRARRVPRGRRRRGGPVMTPPGDVPRGPRRARRGSARIAALLALVLVAAVLLWLINALVQPFAGEGTGSVTVQIPEGASAGKIGDVLADAGVVDSGFIFSVRASLSGARNDLRSGRHVLRRDMSYSAAIDALSAKPAEEQATRVVKVTIPEGRSRREIVPIVQKAGLQGSYVEATARAPSDFSMRRYGAPRRNSLEGFLFPATFELDAGASAATLRNRQLDAFRENFEKIDMRRARRRNLTAYDVLIIASMVEREARVARERPLIAAVIHNRLRAGLPLGIDATIRYATGNWSRPLRQSELRRDSPFNTRLHKGLPPTPIGNPGLSSIRAAADPANRDYLYYVVKPGTCGEHAFSSTEAQFERDVERYNRAREEAGGNSPTTC
jgi:UPF0755 protein